MPRTQIVGDVWYRFTHDTWENREGFRTDIAASVLENLKITRALFILDDKRGIMVAMDDLRRILVSARRRTTGKVGPFNVNPHTSKIDGVKVTMEIKMPKRPQEPAAPSNGEST